MSRLFDPAYQILVIVAVLIAITIYCSIVTLTSWKINVYFHPFVFLNSWQQLIGALIGAAAPLSVFLWERASSKKERYRNHMAILEKSLIAAINNLASIDQMLNRFVSGQLEGFRKRVHIDDRNGRHSIGQTLIPLTSTFVMDNALLSESTRSSYLELLILDVISTSNDLPLLIQDLGRQFDRTMSVNMTVGINRLASPHVHNLTLLASIDEFEMHLRQQILGYNIPVYLRKLALTLAALQTLIRVGIHPWNEMFSHLNNKPHEERYAEMDEHFKNEANNIIESFRKVFKSKLYNVGEEIPMIV